MVEDPMRKLVLVAIVVAAAGCAESPAFAGDAFAGDAFARSTWPPCEREPARANPWRVDWTPATGGSLAVPAAPASTPVDFAIPETSDQGTQARRRPVAFEYSDGYKVRARIHKVASIATLPLFVAEYLVGADLYNHPESVTDGKRSTHTALAASTGVLFGINTITGVWNLVEARKDPNHSTRRTIHGILMLVADAGFAATGATAPESEHGRVDDGSRSTHRALALTSMGIATVSYLMMLFGGN
jgi:hypothetical protein